MKKSITKFLVFLSLAIWIVFHTYCLWQSFNHSFVIGPNFLFIFIPTYLFFFFSIFIWNYQNKTAYRKRKIIFFTSFIIYLVDLFLKNILNSSASIVFIPIIIGATIYWCLKKQSAYTLFSDKFISSIFTGFSILITYSFWIIINEVIVSKEFANLPSILNAILAAIPNCISQLVFYSQFVIIFSLVFSFIKKPVASNENILDSDFIKTKD